MLYRNMISLRDFKPLKAGSGKLMKWLLFMVVKRNKPLFLTIRICWTSKKVVSL